MGDKVGETAGIREDSSCLAGDRPSQFFVDSMSIMFKNTMFFGRACFHTRPGKRKDVTQGEP